MLGYTIPYYNIEGRPVPFYRVRLDGYLMAGKPVKYKQLKGQPNRVYFPKQFKDVARGSKYIVICEGEKKAVTCCNHGIPAVALSGVDSWRNRTLVIPKDVKTVKVQGSKNTAERIGIRLPSGTQELDDVTQTTFADGFLDLIDYAVAHKMAIIIAFDADVAESTNIHVQRAAANIAFELRYRGIPYSKIHQFKIPNDTELKMGLDDWMIATLAGRESPRKYIESVLNTRGTFPIYPNMREWLNQRLQRTKLGRKETQMVSLAILSDLDANGKRLRADDSGQLYYFDSKSKTLMKVYFSAARKEEVHESDFGQLLYSRYGLTGADSRILTQLSAQYSAEDPIDEVTPQRVVGRIPKANGKSYEDNVCYQISDGQFIRISGDSTKPFELCDNGDYNVLFESNHVEPIDGRSLLSALNQEHYRIYRAKEKPRNLWYEVLQKTRLKDKDSNAKLFSYLYYISPWLWRWRGTQLPAEIVLGEAGSGKSSAYILRLQILTGIPLLRNAPADIKDWHSSVVNTGGLHVVDNLHLANKQLRQQLSDEMCRIITEPNPSIEQRRLYSNAELMRLSVSTTFAITALQQPFQNIDILQRAMVMEMDKAGSIEEGKQLEYQSDWVEDQLHHYGGRKAWLVNQLTILQLLLNRFRKNWDYTYKATHRLVNFEYIMSQVAQIFGDSDVDVKALLFSKSEEKMTEADWVLEGLKAYADQVRKRNGSGTALENIRVGVSEISDWALGQEDYEDCQQLINSRKLGRYIQANTHTVSSVCGLVEDGKQRNRVVYKIKS